MNILICSQLGELQIEPVWNHLKKMGANPVLFERYRKDQFISYFYEHNIAYGVLNIGGEKYPLTTETFPAIWYWLKPVLLSEIPGESSQIQERFCIQEWKAIIQSLDLFLSGSKWINTISCNYQASRKPYQLKMAMDVGLTIPTTVITNDAIQALQLFDGHRVIYKTLSSFLTSKQAIYTNEIEEKQVLQCQQQISMAPGIFQHYCGKKYELRVTVVGNQIFTVKINSQQKKSTLIDWRRCPNEELYEAGSLSLGTSKKLLTLHKQLGLIYAAYDFIVDENDDEIFLECNPSGQWLWLEQAVNLDISLAMAHELISAKEDLE